MNKNDTLLSEYENVDDGKQESDEIWAADTSRTVL